MLPETKYAESGDVHIAYQVVGDGAIDLVIVPRLASHLEAAGRSRRSRGSTAGSAPSLASS